MKRLSETWKQKKTSLSEEHRKVKSSATRRLGRVVVTSSARFKAEVNSQQLTGQQSLDILHGSTSCNRHEFSTSFAIDFDADIIEAVDCLEAEVYRAKKTLGYSASKSTTSLSTSIRTPSTTVGKRKNPRSASLKSAGRKPSLSNDARESSSCEPFSPVRSPLDKKRRSANGSCTDGKVTHSKTRPAAFQGSELCTSSLSSDLVTVNSATALKNLSKRTGTDKCSVTKSKEDKCSVRKCKEDECSEIEIDVSPVPSLASSISLCGVSSKISSSEEPQNSPAKGAANGNGPREQWESGKRSEKPGSKSLVAVLERDKELVSELGTSAVQATVIENITQKKNSSNGHKSHTDFTRLKCDYSQRDKENGGPFGKGISKSDFKSPAEESRVLLPRGSGKFSVDAVLLGKTKQLGHKADRPEVTVPASAEVLSESGQQSAAKMDVADEAGMNNVGISAEKVVSNQDAAADCLLLSSWGLPGPVLEAYHNSGITAMFPWQAQCLTTGNVLGGGNLVYSAPTSAGKTMVAELLMLKRVLETRRKALFILPFVSVTREKMVSLQRLYQDAGVRVGGFMGNHSAAGGFHSLDVAVCTIEKGNGLVNRLMEENRISELGVVVVDELHMVGDSNRGYLLELLLTKISYMARRSRETSMCPIQVIGMSATLPNLDLLAKWLDADLYHTDFRPVPLTEHIKVGTTIYDRFMAKIRDIDVKVSFQGDEDHIIPLCLETIMGGHSILIFCPTKAWCEKMAEKIAREFYGLVKNPSALAAYSGKTGFVKASEMAKLPIDQASLQNVLEQLGRSPVGVDPMLGKVIQYAVAYHHAGLTFDERDIVEGAFRKGQIKVLVATSTLSSGVNLPARRVIVRSPMFGGKMMDVLSYRQMAGRAGRMGVDTEGECVLVCKEGEKKVAENLVKMDLPPVASCLSGHGSDGTQLSRSLKRAVLEVVVSGSASTPADVAKYVSCTLLSASLPANSESTPQLIRSCLAYLEDNEFVRLTAVRDSENEVQKYQPTQLGSAVLGSSMSPDEGLAVFAELQKARQCFVLANELHIIYLVTPVYSQEISSQLDWYHFYCVWEKLTPDMKLVALAVGVDEGFLAKAITGRVPAATEAQRRAVAIHRRFYTALALHELVQEVPLMTVAARYNCNKGQLQSLMQSAATFAGMVTVFCARLGWGNMELLFAQFQQRLTLGVTRELCDLVRISLLTGSMARMLFNAGYQTVAAVAHASPLDLETVFRKASPFQSSKKLDGETDWDADQRRKARCMWLAGRKDVTELEAAEAVVQEAKTIIQQELGVRIDWLGSCNSGSSPQTEDITDLSASRTVLEKDTVPSSQSPRETLINVNSKKRESFKNADTPLSTKPQQHMRTLSNKSLLRRAAKGGSSRRSSPGSGVGLNHSHSPNDQTFFGQVVVSPPATMVRKITPRTADRSLLAPPSDSVAAGKKIHTDSNKLVVEEKCTDHRHMEDMRVENGAVNGSLENASIFMSTPKPKPGHQQDRGGVRLFTALSHDADNLIQKKQAAASGTSSQRSSSGLLDNRHRENSTAPFTSPSRDVIQQEQDDIQTAVRSSKSIATVILQSEKVSANSIIENSLQTDSVRSELRDHVNLLNHDFNNTAENVCKDGEQKPLQGTDCGLNDCFDDSLILNTQTDNMINGRLSESSLISDQSFGDASASTPRLALCAKACGAETISPRSSALDGAAGNSKSHKNGESLFVTSNNAEDRIMLEEACVDKVTTMRIASVHGKEIQDSLRQPQTLVPAKPVLPRGGFLVEEPLISACEPTSLASKLKGDVDEKKRCANSPAYREAAQQMSFTKAVNVVFDSVGDRLDGTDLLADNSCLASDSSAELIAASNYERLEFGDEGMIESSVDGSFYGESKLENEQLDEGCLLCSETEPEERVECHLPKSVDPSPAPVKHAQNFPLDDNDTFNSTFGGSSLRMSQIERDGARLQAKRGAMASAASVPEQPEAGSFLSSFTVSMMEKAFDEDSFSETLPAQHAPTSLTDRTAVQADDQLSRGGKTQNRHPASSGTSVNVSDCHKMLPLGGDCKQTAYRGDSNKTERRTTSMVQSPECLSSAATTPQNNSDCVPPTPPEEKSVSAVQSPCLRRTPMRACRARAQQGTKAPQTRASKCRQAKADCGETPAAVARAACTLSVKEFETSSGREVFSRLNNKSVPPAIVGSSQGHEGLGPCVGSNAPLPDLDSPPPSQDYFCVIDVCSSMELFATFVAEWLRQPVYSISAACEMMPASPVICAGIGSNFIQEKAARAPLPDVNVGIKIPGDDERTIVGLAVSWAIQDAYYISFLADSADTNTSLDDTFAAPPCTQSISLEERMRTVKEVLQRSADKQLNSTVVAFNCKAVYTTLAQGLGAVFGCCKDPVVACWLLDPGAREKTLHGMVTNYVPQDMPLLEGVGGSTGYDSLGLTAGRPGTGRMRAVTESVVARRLMEELWARLVQGGLDGAFTSLEMPSVITLARMELNGFGFSDRECESQKNLMLVQLSSLEQQAYRLAGHPFSLTSTDDISQVLYLELLLPVNGDPSASKTTRTLGPNRRNPRGRHKSAFSTSKDILEKLRAFHPLPAVILEWRRISSALTKHVYPLQKEKVHCDRLAMDRVYSQWQTHTATGRVSMTEPNLQNIPRDFDIALPDVVGQSPLAAEYKAGKGENSGLRPNIVGAATMTAVSMRHAFLPFPGGVLLAADYSQLELRVIAHLSGDSKLISILNNDGDVFKMIAAQWKNTLPELVSSQDRQHAKQICYGMLYGIGAKALGEQIGVPENDAAVFMESFKAKYTGMRRYLRQTVEQCREKGYVTTVTGRKRYLPAISDSNPHARAQAERQAVNTTVQGSAADIVKAAMNKIDIDLAALFPDSQYPHRHHSAVSRCPQGAFLVLQLHDELIYEVSSAQWAAVADVIKSRMEMTTLLNVRLPVKIKIGPSWGRLEEIDT